MPNHSLFDLAYSCVGRYVGWMRVPFSCFWTDSKYWKGPVSSSFAPLPCTVYLVNHILPGSLDFGRGPVLISPPSREEEVDALWAAADGRAKEKMREGDYTAPLPG